MYLSKGYNNQESLWHFVIGREEEKASTGFRQNEKGLQQETENMSEHCIAMLYYLGLEKSFLS